MGTELIGLIAPQHFASASALALAIETETWGNATTTVAQLLESAVKVSESPVPQHFESPQEFATWLRQHKIDFGKVLAILPTGLLVGTNRFRDSSSPAAEAQVIPFPKYAHHFVDGARIEEGAAIFVQRGVGLDPNHPKYRAGPMEKPKASVIDNNPYIYERVSKGQWLTHWEDFNWIHSNQKPLMSDTSPPPPFATPPNFWSQLDSPYYRRFSKWLNEKPPRTWVLSLGEGNGWFIAPLLESRSRLFQRKPLTFEEAPYMAVDATYGIWQGGELYCPFSKRYKNTEPRWKPHLGFIANLQRRYPLHYRHATFQNLEINDPITGARLMFDEIVSRLSLGYVLRQTWESEGLQAMGQILDRVLLHLLPEGRIRITGFIIEDEIPSVSDKLFFDDLESLIRLYVLSGKLRAYNTNFRHMPDQQLILVGPNTRKF